MRILFGTSDDGHEIEVSVDDTDAPSDDETLVIVRGGTTTAICLPPAGARIVGTALLAAADIAERGGA